MTQATGSSFFTQAMALATANTTSTALPELLAFMGNRLGQTRANQLLAKVGNLLTLEQQYTLKETYLYGSSRLGVKNQQLTLSTRVASVQNGSLTPIGNAILNTDSVFTGTAAVYGLPKAPNARVFNRTWGLKQYELSNHLGNVQVTVSDKKIGVLSSNQVDYVAYEPEVKSATDYYAYGMEMPGKGWRSEEYRYGFNGKENISFSLVDYGERFYDIKLSRFLSIDPYFKKFPMLSSYQYASLNPIMNIDLDGLEGVQSISGQIWKNLGLNSISSSDIEQKVKKGLNYSSNVSKDVLTISGGVLALIAASSSPIGWFSMALGVVQTTQGIRKLVFDLRDETSKSEEIQTSLSGTIMINVNYLMDEKMFTESQVVAASITEGVLTLNWIEISSSTVKGLNSQVSLLNITIDVASFKPEVSSFKKTEPKAEDKLPAIDNTGVKPVMELKIKE